MVEFDKILEEMGKLSKRQKFQLFLMFIPNVLVATHMGSMVFIGGLVDKRCEFPLETQLEQDCRSAWTLNQTVRSVPVEKDKPSECKRYDFTSLKEAESCAYLWGNWSNDSANGSRSWSSWSKNLSVVDCTSWVYDPSSIFTSTVVNEFDLVCSNDYKRALTQSIFMIGVTIGCTVWGQASDSFGRKMTLVVAAAAGSVAGTVVAFAQSYAAFVALKAISGFCIFACYTTTFVLATEIVAPKYRVWIAQSSQAFFALGFCLLALYGYFIRNWRSLQLLLSIPFAGFLLYYWLAFESPRWLISNGKYKEARTIINKFLKNFNGETEVEELQKLDEAVEGRLKINENEKHGNEDEDQKYGIYDLVRTPNMRSKSFKLFYCWLVCSCVYYGLTLNSADIGGDPFINLFISGIVEVPAVFLCIPMLEKCGRRLTLSLTLILSGCACVAMLFVPKELLLLNITLSVLGKFAIAGAFATVYIFAAELYPTPIRSVGIGVCSSFARVGAILSPIIALLADLAKPLPYVVFGSMSIFGGLLALFLPEVLGIRLPETMAEGEEFGKDQGFSLLKCCQKEEGPKSNINLLAADYMPVSAKSNEENKL